MSKTLFVNIIIIVQQQDNCQQVVVLKKYKVRHIWGLKEKIKTGTCVAFPVYAAEDAANSRLIWVDFI